LTETKHTNHYNAIGRQCAGCVANNVAPQNFQPFGPYLNEPETFKSVDKIISCCEDNLLDNTLFDYPKNAIPSVTPSVLRKEDRPSNWLKGEENMKSDVIKTRNGEPRPPCTGGGARCSI